MIDQNVPGDVIRVDGVTKAYQSDGLPALADVSMDVAAGEVVAVMGPSGSGKSTLLNLIAGLDRPTAGTVTVAGRRIDTLGESALARFRARHVGIIFQFFNLLDDLTVEDNVLLPAQLAGASRRQARARAGELLERMGIAAFRDAYPARMSGGQRQRVAIARALVNQPEVLLADEPTGALDTATGQEIGRLLRQLNQGGQTLVLVTHDAELAERYAARTVRIVDGRLAGVGVGALRWGWPRVSWFGAVRTATGGLLRHKVQAVVLGMVLLVSTASATLGLALLAASNGPFQHAFAAQNGAHLSLTVNPAHADAAQLAATRSLHGVSAMAGPFGEATIQSQWSGQPFGQLTLAGRASPGGPVDDVVLNAGHWVTGPGSGRAEHTPGGGGPVVGSTVSVTGLAHPVTLTVVGFASSITNTADGWVAPAEVSALRAPGAPASAQLLYRFTSAGTEAQVRADLAEVTGALPPGTVTGAGSWLAAESQNTRATARSWSRSWSRSR